MKLNKKCFLIALFIFGLIALAFLVTLSKPQIAKAACSSAQMKRMGDLIAQGTTVKLNAADQAEYEQLVTKCAADIPINDPNAPVPATDHNTEPHYAPGVLGNLDKDGKMPNGEYPSVANGGLIDPSAATPTPNDGTFGSGSLHDDLTYHTTGDTAWIFTIWKVMLGITNVIVVVFLLFLAAVNILHLQYDTYQIKKTLPLLIGGAIAANFSILICRMIVDAAQVLTASFAGNPANLVEGYLSVFMINPPSTGGAIALATLSAFAIPVVIFTLVIIAIAVLVLAFLLWIRKIVIYFLVAVSPVAFILYAFPPTQGVFKQWWSQFIRWVFMGPILMIALWGGSMIGHSRGGATFSFSAALAVIFLTIVACMVPFKLGGAVMGAWGKAGQWATGTGKGGYLRGRVDDNIQNKKDAWKLRGNKFLNEHTPLGAARARHAMEMETLTGENKAILEKRQAQVRDKLGSKQALREAEVANSTSILEEEKTKQTLAVESGNFNHISKRQMKKITGKSDTMDVAQKYIEQANSLKQMQEGLAKRRDLDLQNLSIRDLREDTKFRQQIDGTGASVISTDFDESGEDLATGAPPTTITYHRAIEVAEELRFKAKSETDGAKREKLIEASKHFEDKAQEFQNTHKVDAGGETINYNNYLSRNLSGRRMKVLNPAINDEAEVQVLGSTHTGLVDDTDRPDKTFGTSEWRAKNTDYDKHLKGEVVEDSTAAYACRVQAIATAKVMATARRGDVKGLETMEKFTQRVHKAGRTDFKQTMAMDALKTMDKLNQDRMKDTIAKQAGHTNWATIAGDPALQADALNKFNFQALDTTSTGNSAEGRQASANRSFIDRFLTQVESDDKLGLSSSSGVVLKKV